MWHMAQLWHRLWHSIPCSILFEKRQSVHELIWRERLDFLVDFSDFLLKNVCQTGGV